MDSSRETSHSIFVNITKRQLSSIVGPIAVSLLRDIYIYKLAKESLPLKHGVSESEMSAILEKISKEMVYEARQLNYRLTTQKVFFQEKDLERWVWREFIQEEMSKGKHTGRISAELGIDLGIVNSYV